MQERFFDELRTALSAPRLDAYRKRGDANAEMAIARYRWNLALSAAFYPWLHLMEVVLRNNLYFGIKTLFNCDDWFEESKGIIIEEFQKKTIQHEISRLSKINQYDINHLLSSLNLGFWTGFFNASYEIRLWHKLWKVKAIFPLLPRPRRTRGDIAAILFSARELRNRIAHHEPIWYRPDLLFIYSNIVNVVNWIQPNIKELCPRMDELEQIYARGEQAYYRAHEAHAVSAARE